MTTRSTSEAMARLHESRRRLIDLGRKVAVEIARADGEVHSRLVRQRLVELGEMEREDKGREFWLGAVFYRAGPFEWTGRLYTYTNHERNIHKSIVKIWRLRGGLRAGSTANGKEEKSRHSCPMCGHEHEGMVRESKAADNHRQLALALGAKP